MDLDEDSMGMPLTDTGFMTEITKEEETAALAKARTTWRRQRNRTARFWPRLRSGPRTLYRDMLKMSENR